MSLGGVTSLDRRIHHRAGGNVHEVCGYTDADVDRVFAAELEGFDRDEIKRWYNGYNWTGTAVYNPFDLLLLFREREFGPYWFETGTPGFLIDMLAQRQVWLPRLGHMEADMDLLGTFEVDAISVEALMFQAGYLTIDSVKRSFEKTSYRLRYPNHEVYQSLSNCLLRTWTNSTLIDQPMIKNRRMLGHLLLANDFAGMQFLFTAFFASIPHQWFTNNPIAQYEGYYASVFYSYFAALGLDITAEDSSNAGRLDMAVRFNGHVYLFEFKVVELDQNGRALAQIKSQGYADKYLAGTDPIHLIGVEFSTVKRSVVGFEVETLPIPNLTKPDKTKQEKPHVH